jgi:hypothetical protein
MEPAKSAFSVRDWFGLIAGICVGLVLSRFFASDDMTGPWLVILLGPPLVLLISSSRPILMWQVPVVTGVFAGAFRSRSPDDSIGGAFAEGVLFWFVCSLLSSPWALIFHYRARRFRQLNRTPGISVGYVGMVVLVFVCCALTFLGFVATVYPIGGADKPNHSWPLYGVLMVTAGIGLSLATELVSRKLEVQKPVRGVFELLMIPGVLLGIAGIVDMFVWHDPSVPRSSASYIENLCNLLVGMEALAAMIWLVRLERRDQSAEGAPTTVNS